MLGKLAITSAYGTVYIFRKLENTNFCSSIRIRT